LTDLTGCTGSAPNQEAASPKGNSEDFVYG